MRINCSWKFFKKGRHPSM